MNEGRRRVATDARAPQGAPPRAHAWQDAPAGRPDRPALFRADILGAPESLGRLLDSADGPAVLGALDDPAIATALNAVRRVGLVGMGSSRFAALTAARFFRDAGLPVEVELGSTSQPILPDPELLVVGVSSSGSTTEVVAAARRHQGRAALVLGVTNRPGSPLAGAVELTLPLLAGEETAGIACRTYGASVAALILLAGRLGARRIAGGAGDPGRPDRLGPGCDDLRRALPILSEVLDGGDAWLPWAVDLLDGAPAIHVLGDAGRFGSVEQAALMLREAPRLPATAFDAGDWLHVGLYTALPGTRVVLFAGTPYDAEVARVVRERGAELLAIGRRVDGAALSLEYPGADDPLVAALVETPIVELLAAELWDGASATELP